MSDTRETSLKIPFAWSLVLHVVALGAFVALGVHTLGSARPAADADPDDPASRTIEQDTEHHASQIKERIDRGLVEAANAGDAANLVQVDSGAQWLDANSSEQAVAAIAERVRAAYDTPKRAYEPVTPPPPGPFDYNSMLPSRSEKRTGDDGVQRSHQTWVDRDGRTMVQTRRRYTEAGKRWMVMGVVQGDGKLMEMSPQEDDGSLDSFDSAFGRTGESSVMQKLFSEALLPVLEAKRAGRSAPPQVEQALDDPAKPFDEGTADPIRRDP